MCLNWGEQQRYRVLDNGELTRAERLQDDREAVRRHHLHLALEAERSDEGRLAFEAHRQAHHDAAVRLRAERAK